MIYKAPRSIKNQGALREGGLLKCGWVGRMAIDSIRICLYKSL